MKQKTAFHCTNCDYRPPKWVGCCPECSEWGSIAEVQMTGSKKGSGLATTADLKLLHEIPSETHKRFTCGIDEWDRVLGGGIVPGSFLILTGDPGIGKSTLLLQVASHLAQNHTVFYFSSEESLQQVKLRAERLQANTNNLYFSDKAELETIAATAQKEKPHILIIDSIQNCYFDKIQTIPGSVGQLREAGFFLMQLAKQHNIAIILTGHITKDGTIAGPKMLEHMVDGVFYLQGEDRWQTRILRSVKNRFGALDELGFFQMEEHGLEQVPNINQQLLSQATYSPGSCLISSIEGSRPLLVELQALTVRSKFGMPQRIVSGIDQKQVQLIAANLEKYLQIKFSSYDIFFKVSGCLKIKDNSADLGIALALLSSFFQKPLPEKSIALGEISLTGQIKPVNLIKTHINEAQKFGIERIFLAKNQAVDKIPKESRVFKHVYELLSLFED